MDTSRPQGWAGRSGSLIRCGTAATILALLAVWILAAAIWPRLPESIPVHFGPGGLPDRWGARSASQWFVLPAIPTAMAVLLAAADALVRFLARYRPLLVNVPRKKEFAALPEEARLQALLPVRALCWGAAAPVAVMFGYILWATYAAAVGGAISGVGFVVATVVSVGGVFAWTAVCLVAAAAAVREETGRAGGGEVNSPGRP